MPTGHTSCIRRCEFSPKIMHRLEKQFVQLARRISLRWGKKLCDTMFRSRDLAGMDRQTDTHTHTYKVPALKDQLRPIHKWVGNVYCSKAGM